MEAASKFLIAAAVYGPLIVTVLWLAKSFFNGSKTEQKANEGQKTGKQANLDRVVIVTGCDSGIGLDAARLFLESGYHVVPGCLNLSSKGAYLLASMGADVVHLDVCAERTIIELVKKIEGLKDSGKVIWCVINNAGVMTYAKAEWQTWDIIESQLKVNLEGTIQVTRSLLPFLRQSKGRIINVSSPQGLVASPFMSVYCASKWGVEAFSQALRREVNAFGVKVIVFRPCNIPHKTSILKQNSAKIMKMKSEMSTEGQQLYEVEMNVLIDDFKKGFGDEDSSAKQLNDPYLTKCLREAVGALNPSRSYTAAPLSVKLCLGLLNVLPEVIVDFLMQRNIHNVIISWGKVA